MIDPSSSSSSSQYQLYNSQNSNTTVINNDNNINIINNSNTNINSNNNKNQNNVLNIINNCINYTNNLTDLSEQLQVDNIASSTTSGHTDYYYPTYSLYHDLAELTKIRRIPIPNELIEQFKNMQYTCLMGLFTNISRAWIAIDNLIFFWNYEDGSDICFYDNLNEAILAVELFKPKKDSFPDGVEFGLCIATCNYIVLLSVEFLRYTKGNGEIINEMRLSTEPFYTITADNIIINTIKSSINGRIFMGAKDGCLYEFFYQNQTGWFSSQTKRINLSHSKFYYFLPSFLNSSDVDSIVQIEIDESRNILYTRSENSTIQVFYLGSNGLDTSKICMLTCSTIANKAATLLNTNDKHIFMPLVHIASISKSESLNIDLVAVTQFGLRLYFSLNPFDRINDPPSTFQLVHVRLAPNIDLGAHNRFGPVLSAFCKNGLTLMMTKRDEQTDSVLLLANDLYLFHNQFKESKTIFDIDGRIWCMDEINTTNINNSKQQTPIYSSKLSSQLFDSQRRFVMITPQGCFMWNKLRPVDQMCYALIESNGPNSDLVRMFFNKIYSRAEACLLCLTVALGRLTNDNRLNDWATQAFMVYGGEAEIRKRSSLQQQQQQQDRQINRNYYGNPGGQQTLFHNQTTNYNNNENTITYGNNIQSTSLMTNDTTINNTQNQNRFTSAIHPNSTTTAGIAANYSTLSHLNSPKLMSTPITVRTKTSGIDSTSPINRQPSQYQSSSATLRQQQTTNTFANSTLFPNNHQQQSNENLNINSEFELIFSGKHDALFIYVSRLLSPIWNVKLLDEFRLDQQQQQQFATFTPINIEFYIEKLNDLKCYLELNFNYLQTQYIKNYQYKNDEIINELFNTINTNICQTTNNVNQYKNYYTSIPLNTSTIIAIQQQQRNISSTQSLGATQTTLFSQNNIEKLAIEIENQSMIRFKYFIDYLIEVFHLWKILDEHKYHFISIKLDKQINKELLNYYVKDYLFTDKYIYEQLITALLHRYIDENANTDSLNKNLKQFCPSLFTNENAIFTKACEKLKQAINLKTNDYEKNILITDAVDLIKQISYVTNLIQVVDILYSAQCFDAIIDLCLSAAEKRDPKKISLYYYHKGEPSEDEQGAYYYLLRSECYNCMIDCLTQLLRASPTFSGTTTTTTTSPTGTTTSSSIVITNKQLLLNQEEISDCINELIERIIKSNDELAHVFLFNWMINNKMKNKLFELNSPFIESYLRLKVITHSKNRSYLDLMWLYYDNKKDYLSAAKVLTSLAETINEHEIKLSDRIDYLSRAIVALSSSQKTSYKEEENELKDKLEIAMIQEKIYNCLLKIKERTDEMKDAIKQLDSQLFDITKLYVDFAEKFELYECQLFIFKTSSHYDPKAIEFLWKNLIANELEKMLNIYSATIDQKNTLANSISTIAEQYVDNEKYFPLQALIDSLEFISLSRHYGYDWCPNLLRSLKIPYTKLLVEYDRLIQNKDVKWIDNESSLINAIHSLIKLFVDAPNSTTENDKSQFIRLVRDLIPKYLNQLVRINDELSTELISKFESLSHMFDRMIEPFDK